MSTLNFAAGKWLQLSN